MANQKNVLILAYDYPPYVSVGGLRPFSWFKYFPENGIFPVVITRQWENQFGNDMDYVAPSSSNKSIIENSEQGTIIRTPFMPNYANKLYFKHGNKKHKLLRKAITAFFEFFQWLFLIGPRVNLFFSADEYLKTNKVDLIIATGEPFVLFRYASILSSKYGIPWIADYRDPWSQSSSYSKNIILKTWYKYVERKTVKTAHSIVTVSEFVKSKIGELITGKDIHVILNGFDPDAVIKVKDIKQLSDYLTFGFVGTIYPYHPIKVFFNVLREFITDFPTARIRLNFYGINIAAELQQVITKEFPELIKIIKIFPKIPNDQLLEKLSNNNVMLLFNYFSIMGTKIFDYLGIKRTILLCFSDDEEANKLKEKYYVIEEDSSYSNHLQEDLILETNSGHIAKDAEHLKSLLKDLYCEFEETGAVKCNTVNAERYSRKFIAKKLAEILSSIITKEEDSTIHICSRCVMEDSDVDITINKDGHCNHCSNFFERISHRVYQGEKSETDLLQIIDKIKLAGKKSKYDCVIGVSGGVDSSYLAYKAKKRGLRALLVHLDNGWNSEVSVKNIKNLADILGFDYESFVLDWEEFKDLQLSFLRASVPEMETPTDIAILGALHKVAAKYGVKYILSGGNFATEGILPKTWHYDAKDAKYLYSIHKKFGRKKLKSFPMFGFKQEAYYKFIKGIKIVYLLNYFPYNKEEAMKILQNELGWRYYGGKHYESKYTGFVQSYIMPVKFNMDYRRATFSTQICTGEVTREWALAELEKPPYNPSTVQAEKEYICKKLGISLLEFERIMDEPPKLYRDYPNNEKMLQSLYRLYRKITKTQSYKGD